MSTIVDTTPDKKDKTCFWGHKWGGWSPPFTVVNTNTLIEEEAQERQCQRCNKIERVLFKSRRK